MGTRGRPSSKDLEVTIPSPVKIVDRLRPPHQLTDEECEVWAAVVASEPAEKFGPSTVPLLAQYCRHTVQSNRLSELIERATSDPALHPADYERLLRMQVKESNTLAMLATKMRLTQQATTNHRGNKIARGPGKAPWEFS
jgi:hypothetical protein